MANCNYATNGFVFTPIELVTQQKQMKYNEAHMRTYAIWDAINLWKRRFKCLQTLLNHKEGSNLEHRTIAAIILIAYSESNSTLIIE